MLFSHAPQTLAIVAVVGVATALMAGTIGLVQNDIKRVLAYSTVSQLGYMFLAMGVGAFGAGIFHLYTHAFFKALLFLGSGAVIHALARRAGHPPDGRPQAGTADHVLDVPDRGAGDCRRARAGRLLQQGRDSVPHVRERAHAAVERRAPDVAPDRHLHVPPRVPRRSTASAAVDSTAQASEHAARARGHRAAHRTPRHAHLHDAPPAMAARAHRAGGRLGVSPDTSRAWRTAFERFLEPSFAACRPSKVAARAPSLETTLMAVVQLSSRSPASGSRSSSS